MNETTRTYPRTLEEALPENTTAIEKRNQWMWYEANHNPLLVANYRVHVVADTIEHRTRYGIKNVVEVTA